MDARLLEILVCPLCKSPLKRLAGRRTADGSTLDAELLCKPDRLAFPVRDGIPVMLVEEARKVGPDPAPRAPEGLPDDVDPLDGPVEPGDPGTPDRE